MRKNHEKSYGLPKFSHNTTYSTNHTQNKAVVVLVILWSVDLWTIQPE